LSAWKDAIVLRWSFANWFWGGLKSFELFFNKILFILALILMVIHCVFC
jgi:hypothetical protein